MQTNGPRIARVTGLLARTLPTESHRGRGMVALSREHRLTAYDAIVWPLRGSASDAEAAQPPQRHVIECKVLHGGMETTIREGVAQTLDYMDRCGAESGHLVVFNRSTDQPWEEKLFRREESVHGRGVTVWGA